MENLFCKKNRCNYKLNKIYYNKKIRFICPIHGEATEIDSEIASLRVFFIAPPASGKTLVSKYLIKEFNFSEISFDKIRYSNISKKNYHNSESNRKIYSIILDEIKHFENLRLGFICETTFLNDEFQNEVYEFYKNQKNENLIFIRIIDKYETLRSRIEKRDLLIKNHNYSIDYLKNAYKRFCNFELPEKYNEIVINNIKKRVEYKKDIFIISYIGKKIADFLKYEGKLRT